eukprot:TRINITY_DN4859_c0_g1_i2.p1 TRINITY_DN4859_c0_g1~~TRINITY_DN4859_c0_g1_i2.p1  ORF type:complete len:608 (+),score=119.86 TRINITY_DN4859_c0_g1_i2:18-1841(+)
MNKPVVTGKDIAPKELVVDPKDFYDLIVDVLILPTLDLRQAGWPIILTNELKEKLQKLVPSSSKDKTFKLKNDLVNKISKEFFPVDNSRPRVCVVGLFDRGKTHLLNKLANMDLGSSRRISTKGLSVKVPKSGSVQNFILIDTAGTNVPMDNESIKKHVEELRKLKPWEVKTIDAEESDNDTDEEDGGADTDGDGDDDIDVDSDDEEDPEETKRKEKEKEMYEKDIENRARDKAIINKQATELFLQELIFYIADVVIVVVNELTFDDQLYCEVLARKMKEYSSRVESDRLGTLYVVHNFKDTVTEEQLEDLVNKYIVNCYDGEMFENTLQVEGMQGPQKVRYFRNKDNRMIHVWLGREDEKNHPSTAGLKTNRITYEYLRNVIANVVPTHKTPLLRDICNYSREVLKELNYFKVIEGVDVYLDKGEKLVIKGKGLTQKIKGKKKAKYTPLKLAPDEVIVSGKSLTFVQSSDFKPNVDVIYKKECMIILVDLPGFTTSNDLPKPVDTQNILYTPFIDVKTDELVIRGQRSFYWRVLVGKDLTERVQTYTAKDEAGVRIERRSGPFERRIKIPYLYKSKADPISQLQHGQLQVVIPASNAETEQSLKVL